MWRFHCSICFCLDIQPRKEGKKPFSPLFLLFSKLSSSFPPPPLSFSCFLYLFVAASVARLPAWRGTRGSTKKEPTIKRILPRKRPNQVLLSFNVAFSSPKTEKKPTWFLLKPRGSTGRFSFSSFCCVTRVRNGLSLSLSLFCLPLYCGLESVLPDGNKLIN